MRIRTGFMLTIICLVLARESYGQNLSNIQTQSIFAPNHVVIDGSINEWGKLQAYNKNTKIYYTISNDVNNLYLIFSAADPITCAKISAGGISFIIHSTKPAENKIISFPNLTVRNLANLEKELHGAKDIVSVQRTAIKQAKEIKLVGFKAIPDSLISIYNEYGVKAAVNYDHMNLLSVEISIPLKLAEVGVINSFSYMIRLNGLAAFENYNSGGTGQSLGVEGMPPELMAPINFSGKYVLAIKP